MADFAARALERLRRWNYSRERRVWATREISERVTLQDVRRQRHTRNAPQQVAPFLHAIQQYPSIETVRLFDLQLSVDSMVGLIDNATSVTTLQFCGGEAPGGLRGALAVAAALQRNTNIRRLELGLLHEVYLIPILNSLASNTSVKELQLNCQGRSLDVSLALKSLLESTTTIQRFEFHGRSRTVGRIEVEFHRSRRVDRIEADTFRPVAQALIQSRTVTDVKFGGWNFDSLEKALTLNIILASKSNLQSLALDDCIVRPEQESFRAAIFSQLQPNSLLRSLEINDDILSPWSASGLGYHFQTLQPFNQLLTAVETSPLERFSIGKIASRVIYEALVASIPRMQVQTLEFSGYPYPQDMKMELLQAVKRNASLRTIVARVNESDNWFDDDDKRKLMSYSARNKFLPEWIENPDVVPKAGWAEYLDVAQTTGPATVFHILRALAPSLGPFDGEQCRKLRRPDSPS